MGVVVDASVCAKWFFPEEHDAIAKRLLLSGEPLSAPDMLAAELGSVVCKRCNRGEIDKVEGARILAAFHGFKIGLVATAELSAQALEIAGALRHGFYDCLYLALAARAGSIMVTADARLHRKLPGDEVWPACDADRGPPVTRRPRPAASSTGWSSRRSSSSSCSPSRSWSRPP